MPVSNRQKLTPYWQSACGRAVVYVGDCREVIERMERDQFYAVVTDPPYGLEFTPGMNGRDWDAPWKVDARQRQASEMCDPVKAKYLRHNVEYVRDGAKFQEWFMSCAELILRVARPGAHMLSFGGTRMWHRMACAVENAGWEIRDTVMWVYGSGFPKGTNISKRVDRLLGAERETTGSKKMNDSRIVRPGFTGRAHSGDASGTMREVDLTAPATDAAKRWDGWNTTLKPAWEPVVMSRKPLVGGVVENVMEHGCGGINVDGCRVGANHDLWPANLIHDGADEQLCRYFYCAKSSDADRPHGKDATMHPTVKPLDLMRYLVRLVCARGGTVLDPFMGSGSTGCAAIAEGMRFVGIEQSAEYADVAIGRLRLALEGVPVYSTPGDPAGKVVAEKDTPPPPRRLRR